MDVKLAYSALVWSTDPLVLYFEGLHSPLGKSNTARHLLSLARITERI